MQTEKLFEEFQDVSAKTWKQKIQYDLKGKDYNENLLWQSPEGIHVKPFYHSDDLEDEGFTVSKHRLSWQIAQEIHVADTAKANEKALDILQRGAESLIFTVPSEAIDIERLLAGIDLEAVPLHFNFRFLSYEYIKNLLDFVSHGAGGIHGKDGIQGKKGIYGEGGMPGKRDIYLNLDIIGNLARSGNWFFDRKKDFGILDEILAANSNRATLNILGIDMALYQNAGADLVQQLAYALAHANEYLHRSHTESFGKMTFKLAVGSNYFFEIAKIRALRQLWQTLAAEYGVPTECHIEAHPSQRNKTLYDYNVNLLRSTTECMSAILGGANTVSNLPYDYFYHKDNEFAERIARNQLLILKEESYFDAVENPASGAYYIESLTRQLVEKALVLFKDIEANGGFLKQLESNTIQRKIEESANQQQKLFEEGKEILVGTNSYQNNEDIMKDNLEIYPFVKTEPRKTGVEPIIERRLAEKMEKERLKKEGWDTRHAL